MSTSTSQTDKYDGEMKQGQHQQGQAGKQQSGQSKSQMQSHSEGTVARTIEEQTAKLPSDVFLWAALGSIGASALLQLFGKKQASLFVGDWVSPLLLFGVYNKIVKVDGSDKEH
jgi:hypothetical protein